MTTHAMTKSEHGAHKTEEPKTNENRVEARKVLRNYLAKGYKGWTWEVAIQEIAPLLGIEMGDRLKEGSGHAAKALRGAYRLSPVSLWETKAWTNEEVEHILDLSKFELEFTLKHRPKVEEKASKKKGDKAPVNVPAAPSATK